MTFFQFKVIYTQNHCTWPYIFTSAYDIHLTNSYFDVKISHILSNNSHNCQLLVKTNKIFIKYISFSNFANDGEWIDREI